MDPNEKWPELSAMLGELGSKLDRLIDAGMENALPDYADGIVLSATTQTVQLHEGYRYNYLVVSSDAATAMGSSNTLTIDTPGIKYTQPIYEGINPLNIKGSSAKLSVSGLSGQYVAQFVETNESPLVMSAGVVKLTGSLAPLPSPGELLLVGPAANISIPPGASYTTPSYNGLGKRMTGYFMNATLSSTATLSTILAAVSALLGTGHMMYITGNSQQSYNDSSWTNSSAFLTNSYVVQFNAASANTTDAVLNGVSVGIG